MEIPPEFVRDLLVFIGTEVVREEILPAPTELGKACGRFTRRWFVSCRLEGPVLGWDVTGLDAWSQRLGKHVGEFMGTD